MVVEKLTWNTRLADKKTNKRKKRRNDDELMIVMTRGEKKVITGDFICPALLV